MRLLVLGGGGFLGYHVVAEALAAGHDVTVLSRHATAMPGVDVVVGDRLGDLAGLRGREWDAVLDTFTDTQPGAPAIERSARLLHDAVGTYGYVSGMSVYAPDGPSVPDETAPVRQPGAQPDDDPLQERSLAKLAAEAAVTEVFGAHCLFPRVGIMVGPRDPSDRFTWWPVRLLRSLDGRASCDVPCPGRPDRTVQYTDARDVAGWIVRMLADGRGGTFDAVGPGRPDRIDDVLSACLDAARAVRGAPDRAPTFVWLTDEDDLRRRLHDVPDEMRPLWFPEDQIPQQAIDASAAYDAGLRFRPAVETAADTLAWARETGADPLADGPFDERLLLATDG